MFLLLVCVECLRLWLHSTQYFLSKYLLVYTAICECRHRRPWTIQLTRFS